MAIVDSWWHRYRPQARHAVRGELRLRLNRTQAGPAVHACGSIDASNVETLLRVVKAAARIRGASSVVLDLSFVAYLDVAGVAALLECRREVLRRGLAFAVDRLSPHAAGVIEACDAVILLPVPRGTRACLRLRQDRRPRVVSRTFCALAPLLGSRRYI